MSNLRAISKILEPTINLPLPSDFASKHPAQPRALGEGRLTVSCSKTGKTQVQALRHAGSTKLVFPQSHKAALEAIVVNTAGGITGGDTFSLHATAQSGTSLTLTTQAAERAYRAQTGEVGRVTTKLVVDAEACLNWLPQELILFDHCAVRRNLDIDLVDGSRFLLVEPIVFGRTAMNEELRDIRFHDRIRITRNQKPLYLDGMDMMGDAVSHMGRAAIGNGAKAMASLVLVADDAASYLATVRAMLPPTAGASMIVKDVLVVRHLACDSFILRRDLIPILNHLTHNSLPISWRL